MKLHLAAVSIALAISSVLVGSAVGKPPQCKPKNCPTTSAAAPSATSPPTISGVPAVGLTLNGDPGQWTSGTTVTYAYAWERCDSSGANCLSTGVTAATYLVGASDLASTIRLLVTATNSAGSSSAESTPTSVVSAVPSPTPTPTSGAGRQLGVTLPWSSTWLADLDSYATLVGARPAIVMWYSNFTTPMLDVTRMNEVESTGSTPMVTVEPWDGSSATDPRYSLANIAAGNFDAWFAAGAQAAVSYGKPFYLRFAPEMNGAWAPWEAGVNGNTPEEFVAAWRHVHAIFAAHGATNVKWIWAPNVFSRYGTAVDFSPYYPGSDVVDVLGLDGYNWGTLDVWQTYSQVFGPSYDTLGGLDATMPVMITETASAEAGGDKAAWITSAFTQEIPGRTPRVTAVIWFDENKETDWRVNSSASSLAAYRAVAASTDWSG